MQPVMLYLVGSALVYVYGRVRDRKKKTRAAPNTLPESPTYTDTEIASFTRTERRESGDVRVLDPEIAEKVPMTLSTRSIVALDWAQVAPPEVADKLRRTSRVWRVLPLATGGEIASDRLARLHRESPIVLVSFTLMELPTGLDAPVLIVAGDQSCEQLAGLQGMFALLPKPGAVVDEAPAAAEAHATEPPQSPTNGVAANGIGPNGATQTHASSAPAEG